MKTGLKTTEFWLALIVVLLGALASVYAEAEWAKVAGMVASALTAAGYSFARAQVKAAAPVTGVVSYRPPVIHAVAGDPHRYDNPGGSA